MSLQKIAVNLQQSIIWTQKPDVCNTICAITHRHRNVVVILAGYQDMQQEILDIAGIENPVVMYGGSFRIDTWDRMIDTYLREALIAEDVKRLISN